MNYGKVLPVGHADMGDIFDLPVVAQEKVDGSRFTFGVVGEKLQCWSGSRHNELNLNDCGMFAPAIAHAKDMFARGKLTPNVIHFCEFVARNQHNVLTYGRTPTNKLVLFDAYCHLQGWLAEHWLYSTAARIGIDLVPVLFCGLVTSQEQIIKLLDATSYLGGTKIEGIVFKRYDGGVLRRAKYVSDALKETQDRGVKHKHNPDIIADIAECLATDARFQKAYQAVRDKGNIGNVPEDIPRLIKECAVDLNAECRDYVAQRLLAWGWRNVQQSVVHKLADWYKAKLASDNFEPQGIPTCDASDCISTSKQAQTLDSSGAQA
jgi:hypothetical protein